MKAKQLEDRVFEISFENTFDIDNRQTFEDILQETLTKQPVNIFINLKNLEYIDSTALGLLILSKERANQQSCAITLVEPENEHVKSILSMTKFNEMFPMKASST